MVELKEQDFQIFKDEAEYWIKEFGLLDWRIGFAFEKIDNDFYAECRTNWYSRTATLALNKWIDGQIEIDQIRKTAFHEVCELLLIDIRNIALNKNISPDEHEDMVNGAAHGVIRRLENSVWPMAHKTGETAGGKLPFILDYMLDDAERAARQDDAEDKTILERIRQIRNAEKAGIPISNTTWIYFLSQYNKLYGKSPQGRESEKS